MSKFSSTPKNSIGTDALADEEIVCACVNMNYASLVEKCSSAEGMNFESILQKTGAGQKCTACLLDLEFHYSQISRNKKIFSGKEKTIRQERLPFRKRLFKVIDNLSPMQSYTLRDWSPVVNGPGIRQWISISNHDLLFSRKAALVPCEVSLELYDAEGRTRYKNRHVVKPGEHFRLEISQYLEKTDALNIGCLRIRRKYLKHGIRGATRPQIEIDSDNGTCGLHTQGPMGGFPSFMHLPFSPGERLFFAAINCQASPIRMFFTYPLGGESRTTETITIPAFGARLHEIITQDKINPDSQSFDIELSAEYPARRRCLLLVADKNLSKLSITHP